MPGVGFVEDDASRNRARAVANVSRCVDDRNVRMAFSTPFRNIPPIESAGKANVCQQRIRRFFCTARETLFSGRSFFYLEALQLQHSRGSPPHRIVIFD